MVVFSLRQFNKRWSLLSVVGGGVYALFTNSSKVKLDYILGNVGVVFIRHLKTNLNLGGGVAVVVRLDIQWYFQQCTLIGRFKEITFVNVSMVTGLDAKAGLSPVIYFGKYLTLSVIAGINFLRPFS